MRYIQRAIIILLLVLLSWSSADTRQEDALEAYYFYSPACPHCDNAAPFIKELSTVIPMRGFIYGKGDAEPMPFEVRNANKGTLRRYNINKFPTLAILKKNAVKQLFIGEQDIKDARVMLSALRKGACDIGKPKHREKNGNCEQQHTCRLYLYIIEQLTGFVPIQTDQIAHERVK